VNRGGAKRELSTRNKLCSAEHGTRANEGLVALNVHNRFETGELLFVSHFCHALGTRAVLRAGHHAFGTRIAHGTRNGVIVGRNDAAISNLHFGEALPDADYEWETC
jgi:hypothetical protein